MSDTTTTTQGWELLRERDIPELKTRARLLRHVQTGAELLSLENDDENKAFGITFATPPGDSTGVAHILEHAVLCGSRKYPLKDPFIELAKGSLKTFLNAFTYPDKTCYPVASQNTQDFYNLVDVYLDTVLHPRLTAETFAEQGWHYELENPDDPLIYKGVVFNEMKGAYSSPDSRLYREAQRSLFPDTTYGVDSGGDPREIPNLTHDGLRAFHAAYYHPSNARIVFYGDDEPAERLRLAGRYLDEFDARPAADATVALQPRFDAPRAVERFYAGGDDQKAQVTVNWLLPEADDPETVLALNLLDHVLVGTPASPLRKALIESGLGEDLAGGGLADYLRQMAFYVGLKGIDADDAGKVETLILDTLRSLAENGIAPETVEASLNTVEFSLRENNTGSFPRGLLLMIRALNPWLHGGDPFAPLAFEAPLNAVKGKAARGGFFEGLIREHLQDNPHRTTLVLRPDPELETREAEEERARLDKVRQGLSSDDLRGIIASTEHLKRLQGTTDPEEARASLPTLRLEDLDKTSKTIPLDVSERGGGATVLFHDLWTSGIVYLDLGLNLHTLPADLLPLMPLFGRALLEMGTEREDFVTLTQRIGRQTGGIRQTTFTSAVRGRNDATAWLFLRGKAMADQTPDLLAILRDVLLTPRLEDRERFRQIVLEEKARLEARLAPAGSGFVDTRLRARFHEADRADEIMGGIDFLFFLRRLASEVETDWPGVLAQLEQVRARLVNQAALLANVTLDAANWQRVAPELDAFLDSMPAGNVKIRAWDLPVEPVAAEGLVFPSPVNYVGAAANLYDLGYELRGSVVAVSKHLRGSWLWDRVRKEGGAYGVTCALDRHSGVWTFTSYRDPNLAGTLDVYKNAARFLREMTLNERERTRVIIGAIGDLDPYQLPDAKGFTSLVRYLVGETDADRQRMRDEVLATTLADFHAFADVLERVNEHQIIAVLGGEAAISSANAEHPDAPFRITKVL